ncbi:MAG: phage integrase N-terminal SAM-like domain-containing protein [Armatimonadota bacterium]|nr:phage integrase N-terminal SAM-like domain-containing protein [Armatimonadota bacterium]
MPQRNSLFTCTRAVDLGNNLQKPHEEDNSMDNFSSRGELFEAVRRETRLRRMSLQTEKTYLYWIRQFLDYHRNRQPSRMGAGEIRDFLSHLALHGHVAASTQNVALNALVFLYHHILGIEELDLSGTLRAKRPVRTPVVLTRDEIHALLNSLDGVPFLSRRSRRSHVTPQSMGTLGVQSVLTAAQ